MEGRHVLYITKIFLFLIIWFGTVHHIVDQIYLSSLDISQTQFKCIQQVFNSSQHIINKDTKILLYWTHSYGGPDWFGYDVTPFKRCNVSNCFATRDTRYFDIADGLLFNAWHMRRFPVRRTTNQKWILVSTEAPGNEQGNYAEFNGKFNATATYHSKSDIHWRYGGYDLAKLPTPKRHLLNKNYAAGKTKLMAWYVSHCSTRSKREDYIRELEKYVSVDIYGKCGDRTVGRGETGHSNVVKNYKFYFAAENCICEEYASEKLFDYFLLDVVLVVYGGFNYSQFLPPDSYINAMDYPNPADLAKYLVEIDKHDHLYNRFLRWKAEYAVVPREPAICRICSYLHKSQVKTYDRMDLFWNKHTQCSDGFDRRRFEPQISVNQAYHLSYVAQ